METWLRAHGFAGPGSPPEYRLPPKQLKALAQEQRLRKDLEKFLGRSSDKGVPNPEHYQKNTMGNSFVEYLPVRRSQNLLGLVAEPSKAPTTPHPKPRQAPATPLKPAGKRRRYTRKMPPR